MFRSVFSGGVADAVAVRSPLLSPVDRIVDAARLPDATSTAISATLPSGEHDITSDSRTASLERLRIQSIPRPSV